MYGVHFIAYALLGAPLLVTAYSILLIIVPTVICTLIVQALTRLSIERALVVASALIIGFEWALPLLWPIDYSSSFGGVDATIHGHLTAYGLKRKFVFTSLAFGLDCLSAGVSTMIKRP